MATVRAGPIHAGVQLDVLASAQARKLRPVAAVENVDDEADDEPDDKAEPGEDVQAGHEQEAEDHAERWNDRSERNSEPPLPLRIAIAQHDDADGNQDEGKQRADVGEVSERADVEQARRDGNDEAGHPCGEGGRPEAWMDARKDLRQQAVAGHGEPDAGLAELVDE